MKLCDLPELKLCDLPELKLVAGYDTCILGYDPTYSTFGSSSSCGFAGGSSIESCAPSERGFGIRYGIIPAFNTSGEAFSLLSMSSPAMPVL